jgi:hypothetical protein
MQRRATGQLQYVNHVPVRNVPISRARFGTELYIGRKKPRVPKGAKRTRGHARPWWEGFGLSLQLPILGTSESMGHHDSEIMDDRGIDRDDA